MLQVIHKYKRSLLGFVFLGLLALMLGGMGLDSYNQYASSKGQAAIQVNGDDIQFAEVARMRRNGAVSAQQAVDHLIDGALIQQASKKLGLAVGDDSVRSILASELPGGLNQQMMRELLRSVGMSAAEFEENLRTDALQRQFTDLLRDASMPSVKEAKTMAELSETAYTAVSIEFNPENFLSKTSEPSEEAIGKYYDEHPSDFEISPGVQYDYVLFSPQHYEKAVIVPEEDVELYYADHESDYAIPEAIKARHIRLMYGKDSKPAEMAELKEKANQIWSRANAGEDFNALVLEFSDDPLTKNKNGELGWLNRGKMAKEFDAAAFKMKEGGIAELVTADYGFHIVKVDEYKPVTSKPLAEVRDGIIAEIRKQEAPAYAAARAAELFDDLKKSGSSLSEFAGKHGLTAASTNKVLAANEDPEAGAKGLTAEVLANSSEKFLLADFGEQSALVEVKSVRESDIAALDKVRDQIKLALKKIESKKLAKEAAEKFLAEMKPGDQLMDLAKKAKLDVKENSGMYRTRGLSGIFTDPEIKQELFATFNAGAKPSSVYESSGKYYLFQVKSITPPDAKTVESKLKMVQNMQTNRVAGTLIQSLINQAKKNAEIELHPQVLADS